MISITGIFKRWLGQLAVQVLLAMLAVGPAHAHAILIESTPADNAVLKVEPREVILRFNARIEKGVSQFTLHDEKGRKIALPPQPKGGGTSTPDRIIIELPGIGPGVYRLEYLVLAADGHATPGILRFTVSRRGSK
jgi:methionine-rich copper-binding protein CopC